MANDGRARLKYHKKIMCRMDGVINDPKCFGQRENNKRNAYYTIVIVFNACWKGVELEVSRRMLVKCFLIKRLKSMVRLLWF